MSNRTISTQNEVTSPGAAASDITGTTQGTKRGLDVTQIGESSDLSARNLQLLAEEILRNFLEGTMPRSVFDERSLVVTGTTYVYTFKYKSIRQFVVTLSDPAGNYTITVAEINNFLNEGGTGSLLLESGDELLLEA